MPGAGGCPPVPIVDGKPDPAALAVVENDPNCFTLYSRFPGGFTPQFGGLLTDHSAVDGLQHTSRTGFTWDASAGIGRSRIDQFIYDTVNASLGYETPTEFDPGSYEQHETNLNFDIAGPVGDRLHVARRLPSGHDRRAVGAVIGRRLRRHRAVRRRRRSLDPRAARCATNTSTTSGPP